MATTPKPITRLDRAIAQTEAQLEQLRLLRDEIENEVPELVGLAEAAALLEMTSQEFSRRRRKGRIPPPVAELASGPVWLKAQFTWPNQLKETA